MHLAGGKHAHHCCLHFPESLCKLRVGCNKVVVCHVLLDQCVGKVARQRGDLACLVLFLSCVGAKCSLACCHAVDVMHFGKGCHPMGFLVGPGVVNNGMTVPLAPCHGHVAARECVLCPSGGHGGLGDGYSHGKGNYLATFFLPWVDSQGQAWVNPHIEVGQVAVKVGLANLRVHSFYVLDKHAEVDTIQALNQIVKDCIEYVVNGGSKLVASDGRDEAVGSPCFARRGVLCPELLALMGSGAGRYNGIQRRFGYWCVE
jgi:hypothetical protein